MTATRDGFKMFSFPVMQSAFCLSNVEILAVSTTSFINNSRHLETMNALENNPEIHAAIKFLMQIFICLVTILLCTPVYKVALRLFYYFQAFWHLSNLWKFLWKWNMYIPRKFSFEALMFDQPVFPIKW